MKKPGAPKWPFSQREVASFIVKLDQRGDDCADKLASVSKLVSENQAAVAAFNKAHAKH